MGHAAVASAMPKHFQRASSPDQKGSKSCMGPKKWCSIRQRAINNCSTKTGSAPGKALSSEVQLLEKLADDDSARAWWYRWDAECALKALRPEGRLCEMAIAELGG